MARKARKQLWEWLDDPTTTGTFLGFAFLSLRLVLGGDIPPDWVIGLPWAIVGVGGVAIALHIHVDRCGLTWGWQSFWHRPTEIWYTLAGIGGHLPQAVVGMMFVLGWI